MASESRQISAHIDRPVREVYDYTSDHANLPAWASGIGDSIEYIDGEWIAESAAGRMVIAFEPPNDFGVLDHTVRLETGESFYNPMRVIAHDDGSEVIFSLRRSPGQSDEEFETDAATIASDLRTLTTLLESADD